MLARQRGNVEVVPWVCRILEDAFPEGFIRLLRLSALLFGNTQQAVKLGLGSPRRKNRFERLDTLLIVPLVEVGQGQAVVAPEPVGVIGRQFVELLDSLFRKLGLPEHPRQLKAHVICKVGPPHKVFQSFRGPCDVPSV